MPPPLRIGSGLEKSPQTIFAKKRLLRFFEDETKGVKVDPKIVVVVPISLIVVSWLLDILLIP